MKTRQQKIEALAEEYAPDHPNPTESGEKIRFFVRQAFKAGVLAGIKLRDEELLAMEFDETLDRQWFKDQGFIRQDMDEFKSTVTYQEVARAAIRWQFEQFIKAIKSPTPEGEKENL